MLSYAYYNGYAVHFYVRQSIAYTDEIATGYTITITFTVTEK
jgi:hypothetical protein